MIVKQVWCDILINIYIDRIGEQVGGMLLYPDAVEKAPEMIDMFQVEHFLLFFFFYKILYILTVCNCTVVINDKGGTIQEVFGQHFS